MSKNDLPQSFGKALEKNKVALKQFNMLSENQKQTVINKSRKINSGYEMDCFINYFADGSLGM